MDPTLSKEHLSLNLVYIAKHMVYLKYKFTNYYLVLSSIHPAISMHCNKSTYNTIGWISINIVGTLLNAPTKHFDEGPISTRNQSWGQFPSQCSCIAKTPYTTPWATFLSLLWLPCQMLQSSSFVNNPSPKVVEGRIS